MWWKDCDFNMTNEKETSLEATLALLVPERISIQGAWAQRIRHLSTSHWGLALSQPHQNFTIIGLFKPTWNRCARAECVATTFFPIPLLHLC